MAKEEKEKRYVYVRDPELTVSGITQLDDAIVVKDRLLGQYPEPEFRVRNRYRSRTGMWDVLVKRRTEVRAAPTRAEIAAGRDQDFIGQHALTGE